MVIMLCMHAVVQCDFVCAVLASPAPSVSRRSFRHQIIKYLDLATSNRGVCFVCMSALHRSLQVCDVVGFEGWHLFISWRTQPATASTCVSRVLVVGGMSKTEELSVSDREFLRKDVLVRVRLDLCMFVGVALGRNSQTQCLIQTRYTTAERRFIRDFLIDHEAKLEDEAESKILDDNRQLTNIRRAGARCLCPLALTSLTNV